MTNEKDKFQQAQQGSGSAEQTNRNRDEQRNATSSVNQNERNDIASQIGEKKDKISSVRQTGGASGRDDYAGGDANGMRNESTGESTER